MGLNPSRELAEEVLREVKRMGVERKSLELQDVEEIVLRVLEAKKS